MIATPVSSSPQVKKRNVKNWHTPSKDSEGTRITPRENIEKTDWYKTLAESSDDECIVVSTTAQEWYNGVPLYDTGTLNDKSSADTSIDSDDSSFAHYRVLMEDFFREPLSPLKVRTSTLSETSNSEVEDNDKVISDSKPVMVPKIGAKKILSNEMVEKRESNAYLKTKQLSGSKKLTPKHRLQTRHQKESETIFLDNDWMHEFTDRKSVKDNVRKKPKENKTVKSRKLGAGAKPVETALREPEKIMKQHLEPEKLKSMYPKESGIKHRLLKIDISPRKKSRRPHQSSTSSSDIRRPHQTSSSSGDIRRPHQTSSSSGDMRRTKHSSSSSGDMRRLHQTSSSSSDMRRTQHNSSSSGNMRRTQHRSSFSSYMIRPQSSRSSCSSLSGIQKRKLDQVSPVPPKAKKRSSNNDWVSILRGFGPPDVANLHIGIDSRLLSIADNELELRLKVYGNIARLSHHKDVKLDYTVAGQAIKQIDVLQCDYDIVRCINGFLNV